MEPITVINLRGLTPRDIQKHGMRWQVPVPEPISLTRFLRDDADYAPQQMRIVTLEFERFIRETRDGRRQESLICFTKAAELALLLNPDWLPGQRSAVQYLQDQNDQLTDMLIATLSYRG